VRKASPRATLPARDGGTRHSANEQGRVPKCVYLDQNKWIDLARAHYDREDGRKFQATLARVKAAIESGRLLLPMSGVHIMETVAPEDAGRRQRLAEFMVQLSGNRSICTHMIISKFEIRQAVMRRLGHDFRTSVRQQIVQDGLYGALDVEPAVSGVSHEIAQEVLALAYKPETSVKILCDAVKRDEIRAMREEQERALVELEEARRRAVEQLTLDERRRAALFELFTTSAPGRELLAVLVELNIPMRGFIDGFKTTEEWVSFFHSIPTIEMLNELTLARDRDTGRKIHRNDFKDIAFLSVAIPYCNAVVMENYFGHLVQSTGLAGKYGTRVLTDLNDLPDYLASAGCL
jgi:hypothetical protein